MSIHVNTPHYVRKSFCSDCVLNHTLFFSTSQAPVLDSSKVFIYVLLKLKFSIVIICIVHSIMACELKLTLERCIKTTPKTSTPLADAIIRGCQLALGWIQDNSKCFEMFASTLLSHLNSCFKHRTGGRIDSQAAREKM